MASADDWQDQIRKQLIEIFGDEPDTLTRVLYYLDEEDKAYEGRATVPPVWKTLKSTLFSVKVFDCYARRLAEDTLRAEKDARFRRTMNALYRDMMDASEDPVPIDHAQGFDMVRMADFDIGQRSGFVGLARAWSLIPRESQAKIMDVIPKLATNKQVVSAADEVVGLVNSSSGPLVMVGLAVLQLGYDVVNNLRRWWNDEITGERCLKNIIDSGLTVTSGVAGGVAGAALGSLAGPWGTVIGGVAGGMLSSQAASVLSDRLTQWLFGIPKEEALENAYRFLGVQMTSSNHDINTAFHRLCLRHHPDKGGRAEDFHMVQLSMGVIKAARGEL